MSGQADSVIPVAAYVAARTSVAIRDLSPQTKIELHGVDRARFLHNFCTNDVKALTAGVGCEAFVTTAQAKLLALVRIHCELDALWVDSHSGSAATLLTHLDRYRISEKVEWSDRTADFRQWMITGPRAAELLRSLDPGVSLPDVPLGNGSMRIADTVCRIRRGCMVGDAGYELLCATANAVDVLAAVKRVGAGLALQELDTNAFEALRIEAGTPTFGVDIDASNLPQEVDRNDRAISFRKGCYLGQETVARIDALGHVNRRLVGVRFTGPAVASSTRHALRSSGKDVGQVTSVACLPDRGEWIGLAMVRRGHDSPGTLLDYELPTGPTRVVVSGLPLRPG